METFKSSANAIERKNALRPAAHRSTVWAEVKVWTERRMPK